MIPHRTTALLEDTVNRHKEIVLALVLLIAFLLCLVSIVSLHVVPTSDALEYHLLAKSLATGNGYVLAGSESHAGFPGILKAYRPPGFPFLLAAVYYIFGSKVLAGQILQALLETLQCFLLYLIGRRLFSPLIGLTAATFWAAYPISILQSNFLMAEPLFGCLLLASLAIIFSSRFTGTMSLAVIGILWGWATLIKPFMILAPFLLVLWMMRNKVSIKETVRASVILITVMGCIIVPWIVRNMKVLHTPLITTSTGFNLWIGNNPNASGAYRFQSENNSFTSISDEVERDRQAFALAWQFISSRPLNFLLLIPQKLAYLFSSESPFAMYLANRPLTNAEKPYAKQYVDTPLVLHVAVDAHYIFFMTTGILGFLYVPPARKYEVRLFLILIGYWIIVHVIFYGDHRYHYTLMLFFVLMSAYIVIHFEQIRLQAARWKTIMFAVLLMAFLSILTAEVVTGIIRAHS